MNRALSGLTLSVATIGAAILGTGVAEADVPAPSGTYQGSTNIPGGDLVWKGKNFENGVVTNNLVGGIVAVPGSYTTNPVNGDVVIDYTPSGLGFVRDTMTRNADGSYNGTVFLFGAQVGNFNLSR